MDPTGEFFLVLAIVATLLSTTLGTKDKELYCGGKFQLKGCVQEARK